MNIDEWEFIIETHISIELIWFSMTLTKAPSIPNQTLELC